MSENDDKIDGEKEIESKREPQPLNEENNVIRNDSFEVSPPENEADATNVVETDEQTNDESYQTSENSNPTVPNVLYEFPDDSEFCESFEPSTKLRKRSSNTILENTAKKARNNSNENTHDPNSNSTTENKKDHKSSSSVEKSDVCPQIPRSGFVFGCKQKLEGENKKSENVSGRRTDSAGRFTKHKGDTKCNHGIHADSNSSDEADIEDNAEDSDITVRKSPEAPSRILPISSSQKKSQNKNVDTAKTHHLPRKNDYSKTVAKPGIASAGTMIKSKKPVGSVNKNFTAETSKKGKSGTSLPESKVKSDIKRQKKRRCQVCEKKLGLTAIRCRCGGVFCSKHRYDKEHNCTFDYKAMGAEEIRKNNPKVVAEKVKKI